MAYDPNKTNDVGSPIGGTIADELEKRKQRVADGTNSGNVNFGAEQTGQDWSNALGSVFYGNGERPGLLGGTYGVNKSAYWDINGDQYRNGAAGAGARGPTFNGVPQDQSRLQQQQLIQMLQAQAAGTGPSAAQGMLRQGNERTINSAMAMSASGRGPGAAGQAYQANNLAAAANQQMASDSAQLRVQEQLQAQGLLASVLGQTRGQDQGMGGMQLQDQKMRDDMVMQFMKMGYDADQANRQAAMEMEKLKMTAYQGGEGGGGFLGGLFAGLS